MHSTATSGVDRGTRGCASYEKHALRALPMHGSMYGSSLHDQLLRCLQFFHLLLRQVQLAAKSNALCGNRAPGRNGALICEWNSRAAVVRLGQASCQAVRYCVPVARSYEVDSIDQGCPYNSSSCHGDELFSQAQVQGGLVQPHPMDPSGFGRPQRHV